MKVGAIEGGVAVDVLVLLGNTPVALLITLLLAMALLTSRIGSTDRTQTTMDEALGPICSIILITGAGGMFGGVLEVSGVGTALTDSLGGLGMPLLLQAFVIATVLRVAVGSATVALTTAAGLVASQAADLSSVEGALVVAAIAATKLDTLVGPVTWDGASLPPFAQKNVAKTPLVGGQWRLKDGGGYDLVVVDNKTAPNIPTGGQMEPIV